MEHLRTNPQPPFPRGAVKPSGLTGGLGLQALRAKGEGRGVVPHRGTPEGLIPGSPESSRRKTKVFFLLSSQIRHSVQSLRKGTELLLGA